MRLASLCAASELARLETRLQPLFAPHSARTDTCGLQIPTWVSCLTESDRHETNLKFEIRRNFAKWPASLAPCHDQPTWRAQAGKQETGLKTTRGTRLRHTEGPLITRTPPSSMPPMRTPHASRSLVRATATLHAE